jgi:hypothetical protein
VKSADIAGAMCFGNPLNIKGDQVASFLRTFFRGESAVAEESSVAVAAVQVAMPPIRLAEVTKDVPTGWWAALSKTQDRVVAIGRTLREALEGGRQSGEEDPIIIKVSRTRLVV